MYQEEFIVLVPEEHALAQKEEIAFSDLKDEIFIKYSDGFQIQKDFQKLCSEAGFSPKTIYGADDFDTICGLVENELGIAVLPRNYFKYAPHKLTNLSYIRIKDTTRTKNINMICHKQRYLTPATHDLITAINNFFE